MSADLSAHQTVGHRYQLLDKLGQGGMGIVYKAQDRLTGSTVALKHVSAPPETLQFASKGSETDGAVALATEFHILAGLRHPNIVSVLDYGFNAQHFPFYTMELLTGAKAITENLQDVDHAAKVRLIVQILQALAYLHRRGVIHRDLKPGNVQVNDQGQVKVMDFGLALNHEQSKTTMGMQGLIGTLAYMSPELFDEKPASAQSDLYAVGIIAYEMFAGRHPFNTKNLAALINQVMSVEPDFSIFPAALAAVLKRLLDKKPEQRYSEAVEVIEALCNATNQPIPEENLLLRESFLQASSFIGRENELRSLKNALNDALVGKGSVWLVGGESGVGKSRLLGELRTRGLVQGATVLRGQGTTETGRVYHIWNEPVRQLALSVELSDLEAGILKSIAQDISELVGRPIPNVPVLEGQAGNNRLALTLAEVVSRYCQKNGAIVLSLEDLQWAEQSLEPLKNLIRLAPTLPLLIVATYRDDESQSLPEKLPGTQVLKLTRFADDAIQKISESMLGTAGSLPQVMNLLKRETEGNAFFMVEVIRALAEEAGRLSEIGRKSLPEKVMAGGIQQIVRRRIERVPTAMQEWLKIAAVLGREINLEVLLVALENMGLTVSDSQRDQWLRICSEAAVIEIADGKWRFSHDKLRESLLANLSDTERQEMNRLAAEGIEATDKDKNVQAAILFEHWSAAGNGRRALPYAVRYADDMNISGDFRILSEITQRALSQIEGETERETLAFKVKLVLYAGNAANGLGDHESSLKHFEECIALASQLGEQTIELSALVAKAGVFVDQGDYKTAEPLLAQAIQLAEARNILPPKAKAVNQLGIFYYYRSEFDKAQSCFADAVRLYQEVGNVSSSAGNLINLGSVALIRGKRDQAQEYWRESLKQMRTIGHLRGLAQSLQGLGNIARDEGNLAEAQALYEEGIAIFRRTGNVRSEAQLVEELGRLREMQSDFANAKKAFEESLRLRIAINDRDGVAIILDSLGALAYLENDYVAAQKHFQESLNIFQEMENQAFIAIVLCNIALLDLATGSSLNSVHGMLREGLELAHKVNSAEVVLKLIAGFAQLYLANEEAILAAELTELVATHPSITAPLQFSSLNPLQADLKQVFSADELEKNYQRGAARDFETTVKELLDKPFAAE